MIFMNVDLPEPDGPMIATNSPAPAQITGNRILVREYVDAATDVSIVGETEAAANT